MKSNKQEILSEYLQGETSYRILAKKYGISHNTIAKWVKKLREKEVQLALSKLIPCIEKEGSSTEVTELQKQLRAAQLKNKLLETMLDIGEDQYGIDLRKKPGTKQS
jgi:transposase